MEFRHYPAAHLFSHVFQYYLLSTYYVSSGGHGLVKLIFLEHRVYKGATENA